MDIADQAQHQEELARQQAEMFRQAKRSPALPLTGRCYWCDEESPGRTFCSAECAQDWQTHMRKVNGR